jgi:hypothetical protein
MKVSRAVFGILLAACGDGDPVATAELVSLSVDGGTLEPEFSPETRAYASETGLLSHHVRLHGTTRGAVTELRVVDRHGTPHAVERSADGTFSAIAPLELGQNALELAVGTTRYLVNVTRRPEPWRSVEVLGLDPPVENAYFGDYLRMSARFLYVNASRRGRIYEKRDGAWVLDGPSEALVQEPLEWMYEAAVTDDALAFVAQPLGGTETLFAFSLDAAGRFVRAGEHVTNDQGTLRLRGDELVFANAEKVDVFRRAGGTWSLAQTILAPAPDLGFALRPTYFDAPGVALGDGVLVVGTPLASTPTSPDVDPRTLVCREGEACAVESGAVLVYERDAAGLYQSPTVLVPPTPTPDLRFGHAAALDGELLAVGVPRESSTAAESGAVFLFRRDPGGWVPAGMLTPSVARPYDYFGDELVVSGDTVLVGAPGQDSAVGAAPGDQGALDSGGMFAFVREGESFREVGLHKLPPDLAPPFPFPKALQHAGSALAAASNTASAELAGGGVLENAGRAFVMTW